jgi:hypothetical protein
MFKQLAIIIPTRNRSALAIRTAQSVLDAVSGGLVRVLISDNSTETQDSEALAAFAAAAGTGLELMRPPASLSMTAHWEWAISQAQERTEASHFLFLTDRMSFRPGQVEALAAILARHPEDVLSYTVDRIDDFARPVRYKPLPRTGKLFRMDCGRLLALSAAMVFYSCLPRMLNCAVPRTYLERSRARFGSVFASVSPDFCFCYRCLALCDSILYYDKSVLLNYALSQSNGASASRGVQTRQTRDFYANMNAADLNAYSPLPAVLTVGNAIMNEYGFVARESGGAKFPPISRERYFDHLAGEISDFIDSDFRRTSLDLLRREGWRPGLAFRWRRLQHRGLLAGLRLLERRFASMDEAIRYASAHRPRDRDFASAMARRYGSNEVPLPWSPGQPDAQGRGKASSSASAT